MEKVAICTANRVFVLSGIILCAFAIIFNMSLRSSLTKYHVSKAIALKEGSSARQIWSKFPFSYEFHCYIFNVTNPDETLVGEKPIVKEIGPFVYDVWQEKIDIEDHEEDDTVSYTLKRTYFFNASKSNGLSDEDELVVVHYMYVGLANAILRSNPTVIPLMSKSIDSIYNKPKSLFVKVTAKKYLFEGLEIDCVGLEEFFAKILCNDLDEHWFKYRFQQPRKDYYTTSVFGTYNGTAWSGRTRISRGIKKVKEVGKIIEFNNSTDYGKWDDEKCDQFLGTDGFMFHPFVSEQDHLYKVENVLSRTFDYQYDSDVEYNKLQLLRFTATVGTNLDTNPDDKCYCIAPDRCLKDGVFELWKSMTWASTSSNPHFYSADPYYNNAVVGLNPDKEKHMSTIDVHPLTGKVVRANFRLQHNAPLTKVPKYRLLKKVSEAQLPLLWVEEKFVLPDKLIDDINHILHIIQIEQFFGYSMIFVGLILVAIGFIFDYMDRKKLI